MIENDGIPITMASRIEPRMDGSPTFGYPWDGGAALSAIGDDSGLSLTERKPHCLLRPVYINAVEVGFAYSQMDRDRRLHVRGVTIALWYFISKGHQVIALLPHCFKIYTDKSSNWAELMHLFRMNLIEFTPGFGSEKYVEVNRILATRARETGGCVVARSQMHAILDEIPQLDKTIEKRLLMPAFNGDDLIFPMDGPLGRNGPTLNLTLTCEPSDIEWGRCSHHQLSLEDQRTWVQRMAVLVPGKATWQAMADKLDHFTPKISLELRNLPVRPATSLHLKVRPPESNPPDGRGFSHERRALRRNGQDLYYLPSSTGGDQGNILPLPHSTKAVNDLFLPGYAHESLSLEPINTSSDPSTDSSPGEPLSLMGPRRSGGYLNGGYKTYHNSMQMMGGGVQGFGARSRPFPSSQSGHMAMMNRRRPGSQPYWQQKDFPGTSYCGGGFNRFRSSNNECGHCSNCRCSPGPQMPNRAHPMYERRYDQRSDRFYERLGASSDFLTGRDSRFTPIRHNDLLAEGNAYGFMGPSEHPRGEDPSHFDPSMIPLEMENEHLGNREGLAPQNSRSREVFDQVASILGWEKAKLVTDRYPHVHSVQMLIEYAFEEENDPISPPLNDSPIQEGVLPLISPITDQRLSDVDLGVLYETDSTMMTTELSSASPQSPGGLDPVMEPRTVSIPSQVEVSEGLGGGGGSSIRVEEETISIQEDPLPQSSALIVSSPKRKIGIGWLKLRQQQPQSFASNNDLKKKSKNALVISRRRLRPAAQALPHFDTTRSVVNSSIRSPASTTSLHTAIGSSEEEENENQADEMPLLIDLSPPIDGHLESTMSLGQEEGLRIPIDLLGLDL